MKRSALGRALRRSRVGTVLLEAVVALTLLAVTGISLLELLLQCQHATAHAGDIRSSVARANSFLEAVDLWPRADLDRHLGLHHEGPLDLVVDRRTPTLYHVVMQLPSAPDGSPHVLIETILYRQLANDDTAR